LISNYQKYYRSAFIREISEKGIIVQIIDLYPLQAAPFFKIRVVIDKKQLEIIRISISERDGFTYTYTFDTFIKNPKINDTFFIFNTLHIP
jgi:outer membrane lipoprotein-sorting protein